MEHYRSANGTISAVSGIISPTNGLPQLSLEHFIRIIRRGRSQICFSRLERPRQKNELYAENLLRCAFHCVTMYLTA